MVRRQGDASPVSFSQYEMEGKAEGGCRHGSGSGEYNSFCVSLESIMNLLHLTLSPPPLDLRIIAFPTVSPLIFIPPSPVSPSR